MVIVGGGAGGLELAAAGPRPRARARHAGRQPPFPHLETLLHEAAAGTLDIHQEGLSYLMLANMCNFTFAQGELQGIERERRQIQVGPVADPSGQQVLPPRELSYDTLVLAMGSTSNFFNTPGAAEHAVTLDTTENAEQFRLTMLKAMVQVDLRKVHDPPRAWTWSSSAAGPPASNWPWS